MSTATDTTPQRFLRRTSLHENERHTNFRMIDRDVISTLVSEEASSVTSQMSKVYLSLINAPAEYWERDGVLRFAGCEREGKCTTGWEQLVSLVGVASATARKAIRWMSERGVIGYYAGRNGAGIRIFINLAASSIGHKPQHDQKNLRLVHTSPSAARTSKIDTPFKDSFAVLEVSDSDVNPRAPKNGADTKTQFDKTPSESTPPPSNIPPSKVEPNVASPQTADEISLEGVVARLRAELEPAMHTAARQAAAREHERTREWLESRGLPKAARVAQREAFNVLRQHGLIRADRRHAPSDSVVRQHEPATASARPLSPEEVRELAETCVAMLEVHGQPVDVTLAELSAEAGGVLLAEDAPKVRQLAEALACRGGKE